MRYCDDVVGDIGCGAVGSCGFCGSCGSCGLPGSVPGAGTVGGIM
jgi:hypothetical protein